MVVIFYFVFSRSLKEYVNRRTYSRLTLNRTNYNYAVILQAYLKVLGIDNISQR